MFERKLMQTSGFRNTGPAGAPDGFELRVRMPNYHGTRLSLVDGVDVSVGGEDFGHEDNLLAVGGRTYTLAELREETEARWSLEDFGTVRVKRPGGLKPGIHEVKVGIRVRYPYFPPEVRTKTFWDTRLATLIF